MLLALKILILTISVVLVWQDFKARYISIYLLVSLLLLDLILALFSVTVGDLLTSLIPNLVFLFVVLFVLWLYTCIRFKGKVSFFQEAFALGDIGFLLACIPLFTLHGFVLFFTASAVLAIVMTLLLLSREEVRKAQIPFVSYMGGVLILFVGISFISIENFRFFTELMLNF